ncbi:MAG TPA: Uma2 family endonuclease [Terriglobales bacterium]|nr:Uma2 family endonuclease [Terriglobales bacterium]
MARSAHSAALATRHRFSVSDYHRMGEAGVLGEQDRVELIEGEIIEMSPIGSSHAARVSRLTHLLVRKLGDAAIVRVQSPVVLDGSSEPEPDLAILKPRPDFYEKQHPEPQDVLLVIEVADTSRAFDRTVKVPLYGRTGIAEVWLVDLVDQLVEVHRDPLRGKYQSCTSYRRGQRLALTAFPQVVLRVADILG